MTIENKFDDKIMEKHFDNIKSRLSESSRKGVWDIMEEYLEKNQELRERLNEKKVSIIEAGHYFLSYSPPKSGLLKEAARIAHPKIFEQSNLKSPYDNS